MIGTGVRVLFSRKGIRLGGEIANTIICNGKQNFEWGDTLGGNSLEGELFILNKIQFKNDWIGGKCYVAGEYLGGLFAG